MGTGGLRGRAARSSVSRRDFLRVGGMGLLGVSVADAAAKAVSRRNCILVLMTGGPSQLETFDPKPEAPAHIRGPLKSISTRLPGVAFSETLPRLAAMADRFSVIRSLYHDAAPIHETGLQLLQTGRLARGEVRPPAFGSLAAKAFPPDGASPYVVLPRLLSNTGVNTYRGQQAGLLGPQYDPVVLSEGSEGSVSRNPASPRSRASADADYGDSRFGRLCRQACRLVEAGTRCVTVNLFDSLVGETTWDCHGRRGGQGTTLLDYRDSLGPAFDRAVSALLEDLDQRGLLDETLVIATGEFGRTPRVNDRAGRDHWPGAWSALMAGAGIAGGQVIGASDRHAAVPIDSPLHAGDLAATAREVLGLEDATAV